MPTYYMVTYGSINLFWLYLAVFKESPLLFPKILWQQEILRKRKAYTFNLV